MISMFDIHPDDLYPPHRLNDEVSIQWLSKTPSYSTVAEFNLIKNGERFRCVVLFECDHNAILKLTQKIIDGDRRVLEMLYDCYTIQSFGRLEAILGYDHFRDEPRILLYAKRGAKNGKEESN